MLNNFTIQYNDKDAKSLTNEQIRHAVPKSEYTILPKFNGTQLVKNIQILSEDKSVEYKGHVLSICLFQALGGKLLTTPSSQFYWRVGLTIPSSQLTINIGILSAPAVFNIGILSAPAVFNIGILSAPTVFNIGILSARAVFNIGILSVPNKFNSQILSVLSVFMCLTFAYCLFQLCLTYSYCLSNIS